MWASSAVSYISPKPSMPPWHPPKRNYISFLIESKAWNPSWTSRLLRDQYSQKTHSSGSWMPPTVPLWNYSKKYIQQSCIMPWQAFVSTKVPRDEALPNSSLVQAGRGSVFAGMSSIQGFLPASLLHWLCQGDGCISGEPILQTSHPSLTQRHTSFYSYLQF